MSQNCAVILAAGDGKRMRSEKTKVLQEVLYKPMLDWVLDAVRAAGIDDICVVTGHGREQVEEHLKDSVATVVQEQRLGTGHAVMQASEWLKEHSGASCLVLCGDAPLFSAATIKAAGDVHCENGLAATVITAFTQQPNGYGRIVRQKNGLIREIVEERDADEKQKAINEINGGAYWFDVDLLLPALSLLKNENSQGEYYLTDVPKFLSRKNKKVGAYVAPFEEISGANDRIQLAALNETARKRILTTLMLSGVSIPFSDGIVVGPDAQCEPDAVILPGSVIKGKSFIGKHSVIGPNSQIDDSIIGENCVINASAVVNSKVGDNEKIGPFEKIEMSTREI